MEKPIVLVIMDGVGKGDGGICALSARSISNSAVIYQRLAELGYF